VVRTADAVLEAELDAWERVIASYSKDAFFAKVVASQKAWLKRTQPYLEMNELTSAQRAAAYRRFVS
jgi:TRAP-type mannitol/chloroaromatic compound transport system substrate-binding protein